MGFPSSYGPCIFTCLVGGLLIFGSPSLVNSVNNTAVVLVLVTFGSLMIIGVPLVNFTNLIDIQNYDAVWSTLPILSLSLVFHTVVPFVCNKLEYDMERIRISIIIGSFIPLLMFLMWNGVILGLAGSSTTLFDPVAVLRNGNDSTVGILISLFGEFAIITSFIGFVFGLMNFLVDLFPAKTENDPSL